MFGHTAYTVVRGVINPLYHCRQFGRHRQYVAPCDRATKKYTYIVSFLDKH